MIENFFSSINVHYIPRIENQQVDVLAKETSTFTPPTTFKLKYHILMRHMTSIPNNIQHWQFFEDDEQIQIFLETVDDFSKMCVDQEN